LFASQGVPELVHGDDGKQGKILQGRPQIRSVLPGALLDAIERQQKPRPMQIDINPRESKQMDGTSLGWHNAMKLQPTAYFAMPRWVARGDPPISVNLIFIPFFDPFF
jgi:hypothetical protein